MNRSERKAALLSALYMLGFGIGCYNRSITLIFLVTFCTAVVVVAGYYVDRAERRLRFYRRELSRQAREALEDDEPPKITMSKGRAS